MPRKIPSSPQPETPGSVQTYFSLAPNFFDLSFSGGLPEILRNLAVELEKKSVHGEAFSWTLTDDHLELSARIRMHSKG